MSQPAARRTVIGCGLPSSGKSTYIGALWHLLESQEIETKLEYDGLPADRERLNQLADKWRRCENMDRTKVADEQLVNIDLKLSESRFGVVLPDYSGESWRELWEQRTCTRPVAELVERSTGVLLFVHADDIVVPLPVATAAEQAEILAGTPENKQDASSATPKGPSKPFDAAVAPTQAKLVDILQLLANPPLASKERRRLAVILSAWDLASDQVLSPAPYLVSHLPLLGQYLKFSKDYTEVRIYGVSALGGRLPAEAARLRALPRQSDRIRVVGPGDSTSSDLTLPLEWLFE